MIVLNVNPEEEKAIKAYAEMQGMTASEFLRKCALEKIEDEFDLKLYHEAMQEYKANPITYTLEEVAKILGIDSDVKSRIHENNIVDIKT